MFGNWRSILLLALAMLAGGATAALGQATVTGSVSIGAQACPVAVQGHGSSVNLSGRCGAFVGGGPAEASVLGNNVRGRAAANAGTFTQGPTFSGIAASASSSGTWSDVLSWSDPTMSQVVFYFVLEGGLGGGEGVGAGTSGPALPGLNAAWGKNVFSLLVPAAGGFSFRDSLYAATGAAPGATADSSVILQEHRRLTISVPVTGLHSIPFTYAWETAGFSVGNSFGFANIEDLSLSRIRFRNAQGLPLQGAFTLANGTQLTNITPEPGTISLLLTGLGGLGGLGALRRRRRKV